MRSSVPPSTSSCRITGTHFKSIRKLTKTRREALLREAAEYATLKLAEIESRAHFVKDLER